MHYIWGSFVFVVMEISHWFSKQQNIQTTVSSKEAQCLNLLEFTKYFIESNVNLLKANLGCM